MSLNISKFQTLTVAASTFISGAISWEAAHAASSAAPMTGSQWTIVVLGGIVGGATALLHLYQTPPNNPQPPTS